MRISTRIFIIGALLLCFGAISSINQSSDLIPESAKTGLAEVFAVAAIIIGPLIVIIAGLLRILEAPPKNSERPIRTGRSGLTALR